MTLPFSPNSTPALASAFTTAVMVPFSPLLATLADENRLSEVCGSVVWRANMARDVSEVLSCDLRIWLLDRGNGLRGVRGLRSVEGLSLRICGDGRCGIHARSHGPKVGGQPQSREAHRLRPDAPRKVDGWYAAAACLFLADFAITNRVSTHNRV
jgi:hypothetical protein